MPTFRVPLAPMALAIVLTTSACANGDLPGHIFDIAINSSTDECNDPAVNYKESFTYRVLLEGTAATIFIGEDPLATGVLSGCELVYQSTVFTDQREDVLVRWKLLGTATVQLGGGGCDAGGGWTGEEQIYITESTDPDVPRGCTYYTNLTGSYAGEVE